MNTQTFCRNLSLILLALCLSLSMTGTQGFAQSNIWTENFNSYANTAALQAAYTQATNGGTWLAGATTNSISLVADPDGTSGNCLMFNVIPSNMTGSGYYEFYWFYTGTGTSNPFPPNIFQNGTDFNVRYDIRMTSFYGGAGNLSHKMGGAATCMGSWALTDSSAPFIGNRGHIQTINTVDAWTQLFAAFRSLDQRLNNANANMNNGNNGVGITPVPVAINTWYTCRLVVDWPTNGVTTNTNATCTFTIWQRGTSEPGSPTCTYASPAWTGDTAIQKGTSGAKTGDGYGLFGLFQDPGATGVTYQQYIDNVVFQDSLTPVEDWKQY